MYTIKMNADKSLVTTVRSTIYQGECDADTLTILIPRIFNNQDLSKYSFFLRYILPDGTGVSEEMIMDTEPYKNHYRFRLNISSKITSLCGQVELWITILDISQNIILKSGNTYLNIFPTKDITQYLPAEKADQLDKLEIEVQKLLKSKADNLSYDKNKESLQLLANGSPIGDAISIASTNFGDVIEFDENGE